MSENTRKSFYIFLAMVLGVLLFLMVQRAIFIAAYLFGADIASLSAQAISVLTTAIAVAFGAMTSGMKYQKGWFESLVRACALMAVVALSVFSMKALYAEDPAPDAPATLVEETPALAETSPDPATVGAIKNTSLPFIQNKGQVADPDILYYTNTFAGSAGITATGVRYVLPYTAQQQDPSGVLKYNPDLPEGVVYKDEMGELKTNFRLSDSVLAITEWFVGGRTAVPTAQEPMGVEVSSFIGNNQDNWHAGLSTFKTVEAGEVWPGITVSYRATGTNIEKIFTVGLQYDSSHIAMQVAGGVLSVNAQGELVITTAAGDVVLTKPVAFQNIDGVRTDVVAAYRLLSDSTYGFTVGDYNPDYPLVIDPLLAGTYVGGTSSENLTDMVVAPSGDIYISGYSFNGGFPVTPGAYATSLRGGLTDMYIARFSADLSTLKAATFIGGSSIDGANTALAFDSQGNIVATSDVTTDASDFPVTAGAYDATFNGNLDTVLFKMSANLSTLIASTFLGTAGNDYGVGLLVASDDTIYRAILAPATGLQTSVGAYDTSYNGGDDVYIVHLSSDLTTFIAGTYLGGAANDHNTGNHAFVFDDSGNIIVTGGTASAGFPTTVGAYDTSHNGSYDIFVTRLTPDLTTVLASTFVGGSGDDDYFPNETIAKAADGSFYVGAVSGSTNFPVTDGSTHSGGAEVVVSHLSADLSTLLAARYLGGSGHEQNYGIAISSGGDVYLTGYTFSAGYPTTVGAYQTVHAGGFDGYVTRLTPALSIIASTFVGSSGSDSMMQARAVSANAVVVAGYVSGLPTAIPGGYDTSFNGATSDAAILLFTPNLSRNDPPTATLSGIIQSPGTTRVVARLTVSDIEKAETSAAVEYSLDNTTWHNATIAEAYEEGGFVSIAGNVISSIDTTTQTGTKEVVFWWDAGVDIPSTTDASVYLRVTPSDPLTAGTAVTSTSFALNTQTGAGVVAVAPAGGGGGSVVVAPAVALPDLSVGPSTHTSPSIAAPTTPGLVTPTLFGVTVAGGSASPAAADIVLLVRYRDSSPLVQALQQLLNRAGVPVAATGAGSAGNETAYFGPRTVQSLRVFQARALPQYVSPFGSDAVDTFIWNALAGM